MSYPSWRYHRELEARIVYSKEEDEALGAGWADSPAKFQIKDDASEGHGRPASEPLSEVLAKEDKPKKRGKR
jgi:hypothetical protein